MIPLASLCHDLEADNCLVQATEAWPAAPPSFALARQLKLCQGPDTGMQGAGACPVAAARMGER